MSKKYSMDMDMSKVGNKCYLWWFSVVIFNFYQVLARIIPNIIIDDLLIQFKLTANQLASLSTIYLYVIAIAQIPIGILGNIYGMKKVLIPSISLCLIGNIMFVLTDSLYVLQFSRLCVAFGSACSFQYAVKTVVDFFKPSKKAFFIGITLAISYFACVFLLKPFAYIIKIFSWQMTMICSNFLGLLSLVLIILYFPKESKNLQMSGFRLQFSQARQILFNKNTILYGILTVGIYAPIGIFGDFWSTGFLIVKYNLPILMATNLVSWMYVGAVFGCVLIPLFFVKYVKLTLHFGLLIMGITFTNIIYGDWSIWVAFYFFLVGSLTGLEGLCFSGAIKKNKFEDSGHVIAGITGFCFLGEGMLQQLIGMILNYRVQNSLSGLVAYKIDDFTVALVFIVFAILICSILSLKIED